MAVPKRKTSKSRRNFRRSSWNKSIYKRVLFAISLGKSSLNKQTNNFIFDNNLEEFD